MSTVDAFTRRLRAREMATMVNVGGRNADIIPMLARAGAHAAFIDCERTGIGIDAASELILSARACGLPSVVRSHSLDGPELVRFIDRGADALVVPHIRTVQQVHDCVEVMRYACGTAPEKGLIIQIETRPAIEHIEEIAAIDGVDAFLIGPNDIAYEWSGQRGRHTEASTAAIEHVCHVLKTRSRSFGYPARVQELPQLHVRGANLRYMAVDWLIESGWHAQTNPAASP